MQPNRVTPKANTAQRTHTTRQSHPQERETHTETFTLRFQLHLVVATTFCHSPHFFPYTVLILSAPRIALALAPSLQNLLHRFSDFSYR
ncbi:hypothetical protein VNO80_27680 [Phaseolus coccineus]|uniref:Uncharacterized protein n=1 Tax=Phaseolus coccineus TaxID=3886 RepID=A0AAN9LHE4_PHACN